MRLLTTLLFAILIATSSFAQDQLPVLVSIPNAKLILLNGKLASLAEVDVALQEASTKQAPLWFYRDYSAGPNINAIEVLGLAIKYQLTVSLSTKSDFSDYVDDIGRSIPRK